MRRHGTPKPQKIPESGRKLFLPIRLFALSAVAAAVVGCAEIPSVSDDDLSEVAVEVIGGSADVFPGSRFSVPVGGDTLLFVDVSRKLNTRIAGIWVDGGKQCCAEESVVRNTWVSLVGVKGGVTVKVELVPIDTVAPVLELVSPGEAAPGEFATGVSICYFGELEYRLNKTMVEGYIKWWKVIADDGWEDRDSLQVVRIPGDITKYDHDTWGLSYASPDGYLSEGLQRFKLTVSPIAGKRISRNLIVNAAYTFEIQFSDSLGNKSEKISRTVWVSGASGDCQ